MNAVQNIPLSKLKPSPRNVRKTGGKNIDDLAASIAAHGLIQNLTVVTSGKVGGFFEVEAGGRRLRALQQMAKAGTIAADYPVPCRLIEADAALEASLAENTIREAMHPADQFDAFQALSEKGLPTADIAARFGVSELVVKQRMRLSRVSQKLLKEYRAGNATLEQLQALAVSDDHAAQERAWKDARCDWQKEPRQLRSDLARTETGENDRRVRFVGMAGYEAAGGDVKRDLFSDQVFVTDLALLDQLVDQNLEVVAEQVRAEGWAWVEVRREFDQWEARQEFPEFEAPEGERDYTPAEIKELEKLEERDDFEATLRIDQIEESISVWPEGTKEKSGAVVFLTHHGFGVMRGRALAGSQDGNVDDDDDNEPEHDEPPRELRAPEPKPAREPTDLPAKVIHMLTTLQTAALRFELVADSRKALMVLAASLAEDFRNRQGSLGIGINFRNGPGAALELWVTELESWQEKLSFRGPVLDWLIGQPEIVTHELLAFLTAASLSVVKQSPTQHRYAEPLMALLGTDMTDYFEADAEFLQGIPGAAIIKAVIEAKGAKAAKGFAGLKKAELAGMAAEKLKGSRWLPEVLRGPKAKVRPDAKQRAAGDVEDDD